MKVPGTYSITDNTKLSELVRLAGSYTEDAYPLGGILTRESTKMLEVAAKDKSYYELVRYLIASPSFATILSAQNSNGIITFLSLLKDFEPSGRLVTEFSLQTLGTNSELDRLLQDGDKIHIPSFSADVYVFGEIMNPGAVPYEELSSPTNYIRKAGNYSRIADRNRALLVSPDGKVQTISSNRFGLFDFKDYNVLPGSTIYVPSSVAKVEGIDLATKIAPIVSSVALSLASLNSINN